MQTSKNAIAKNLREILLDKSISPTGLARAVGLDLGTTKRLCSGFTQSPHLETLMLIAAHLNVPIHQIIGMAPLKLNRPYGNLNSLLVERKISKFKLARGISVNVSVIYRLCGGETVNPKVKTLVKIAEFLNVPFEQVMFATSSHEKILRKSADGRRP